MQRPRLDVYAIDLDGTVALHSCPSDSDHLSRAYKERYRHLARRGHHDYDDVLYDLPNIAVIDVVINLPHPLMFVTGRPEKCRVLTFRWLWYHIGACVVPFRCDREYLRMRKDGDHRDDSIVKYEIYDQLELEGYRIAGVFNDRQRVVDMERARGYTVFQVAPGNF